MLIALLLAASTGISTQQARTAAPVSVGTANTEGSSLSFARADHVHGPPSGDWSVGTTSGVLNVYQRIRPISPAPEGTYPLGHDLWLQARGSADLRLQVWSLNLTASTSATIGANTVTVNSGTICPGGATGNANCTTASGTASLCSPAQSCSIIIEPDGANEETIASGSWSIVSGTSISFTATKTHSQPYTIRQIGALGLDVRNVVVNGMDVSDRPVAIQDRSGVPYLYLPNDTAGSFPLSSVRVVATLTGANGANKNLILRNSATASCVQVLNSGNTATIYNLCESSSAASMTLANPTNSTLRFQAASDIGRIAGGGTSGGMGIYGSFAGTGTSGNIRFRNNTTDETDAFTVNTGAKQVTLSGVTFSSLGSPSNGTLSYCSDCTIANPCASGGTGALAKRLNSVWVCN